MRFKVNLTFAGVFTLAAVLACFSAEAMEIQLGGLSAAQRAVLSEKQSVKQELQAQQQALKPKKEIKNKAESPEKKATSAPLPLEAFDPLLPLAPEEQQLLKSGLNPKQWEALQQLSAQVSLQQKALNQDLADDKEQTQEALSLLWQHAVQRSGSVRYAIEKLSRRDASGKPVKDDAFSKRLLQNLAQLGGVAGTLWTGSPVALLSGNVLSDIISDPGPKHTKTVSDADMVLLTKTIETLQQQVVHRYFAYRYAQQRYVVAYEGWVALQGHYKTLINTVDERTEAQSPWYSAMANLVDFAQQEQETSKLESKQASEHLALLVGYEGLSELDTFMKKRQAEEKPTVQTSALP
jgi:hypothetical protein